MVIFLAKFGYPEDPTSLSSTENEGLPSIEDDNCDSRVDGVKSDGQVDHSEQLLPENITFCNLTQDGVVRCWWVKVNIFSMKSIMM